MNVGILTFVSVAVTAIEDNFPLQTGNFPFSCKNIDTDCQNQTVHMALYHRDGHHCILGDQPVQQASWDLDVFLMIIIYVQRTINEQSVNKEEQVYNRFEIKEKTSD